MKNFRILMKHSTWVHILTSLQQFQREISYLATTIFSRQEGPRAEFIVMAKSSENLM